MQDPQEDPLERLNILDVTLAIDLSIEGAHHLIRLKTKLTQ
jgi:hypothetical protein